MLQDGYIWPLPPPPNNQIDLREIFPRTIGRLVANTYQPVHVGFDWISIKHPGRIVAAFRIKYREDNPSKVWFLFIWRSKRGQLYGKGTEGAAQGCKRMEWLVPRCSYEKFYKRRQFLLNFAEVIGRTRPYP